MIFIEHFSQLDQIVVSMTGNESLEIQQNECIWNKLKLEMKLLQLSNQDEFIIIKGISNEIRTENRPEIKFSNEIMCKQCEQPIISIPKILKITNLPSSYYKELMECFTCHDQRIETNFNVQGTLDQILKSTTFAIFSVENLVPNSVELKVRNLLKSNQARVQLDWIRNSNIIRFAFR